MGLAGNSKLFSTQKQRWNFLLAQTALSSGAQPAPPGLLTFQEPYEPPQSLTCLAALNCSLTPGLHQLSWGP